MKAKINEIMINTAGFAMPKVDKDFIENEMRLIEPKQLEFFTKNLFINNGKVLFKNEPTEDKFKRGQVFYNRNLHYTLYYNPIDLTLNIFYNSINDNGENIVVIVNKEKVINISVKPKHWHIRTLGIFDNINHVRIDNSEKVIYEKTFDNDFREIFKIKSYITSEKNN